MQVERAPEFAAVLLQIFRQDKSVIYVPIMGSIEQGYVILSSQSVDLGQRSPICVKFLTVTFPKSRKARGIMAKPFAQIRARSDSLQP